MIKLNKYRPKIRSRHPSHNILRQKGILPKFPFKSVIRFGSLTELADTIEKGGDRIEINTVNAIRNSSNKLLMKSCFDQYLVKTADWIHTSICSRHEFNQWIDQISFPVISKSLYGSRNRGNKKHDSLEDLQSWMEDKNLNNYIFEKYYNYNREYRLHISEDGCFYSCRKMLKEDAPIEHRWYRNDAHCVWILEDNISFDKPNNWNDIVKESVNALKAVGLDFGAVDVRVQSSFNNNDEHRENPKFIIIEINSAPSFGEITIHKYIEELPKIINKKIK